MNSGKSAVSQQQTSGKRLGPSVDVEAGLVLKVTYVDVNEIALSKTIRAQFGDTVADVVAMLKGKFELPADSDRLELYAPTPIDSVMKPERKLSSYHYLAKPPNNAVELRWMANTPSFDKFPKLFESRHLPAAERVRALKMHKMVLAGKMAQKGQEGASARRELAAVDQLLGKLSASQPTVASTPIQPIRRERSATTGMSPASVRVIFFLFLKWRFF